MSDDTILRDSLRRQLDLLIEIRNRLQKEPEDWYDRWAYALQPVTTDVISRLGRLEGADPIALHYMNWRHDGDLVDLVEGKVQGQ